MCVCWGVGCGCHLKLERVNFKYEIFNKSEFTPLVLPHDIYIYLSFSFFSDTLRKKNGKFSDIPLLLIPFKATGSAFHLVCRFIYFASVGMPFSCTSCLRAPPQCFALDVSHVPSVHFCLPTSSALPFLLFAMHAMPSR